MKFLLVLTTMAALIAQPLFAQGKNKPAPKKPVAAAEAPKTAPVATAPAPAAPAQEVPTAATAPQSSDSGLKFSALAWGGYNIVSSEEFDKVSSGLTKGGIAGGVELLGGISLIRGGVAVSYLPVYSYSNTGSSGTEKKAFLPIEAVVNVYFLGFYAGGRGGYLLDIGSSSISGQPYTKTNGTIFGGQVGYQYILGSVAIDIGVIATFAHAEAEGTGGSAGAHADYTNIVPRIGIQYTF
jgi:hypothetical protein